jgi:hypothetical protein
MTEREREALLAYMEDFKKKVTGNKELSRQFLIEVGIYTEDGKLTEPCKHLYIPPLVEA